MSRNDRLFGSRDWAAIKDLIESGARRSEGEGSSLLENLLKALPETAIEELRRLVAEGAASGLSEEDGETVLDRLEAKYRALANRKSGI